MYITPISTAEWLLLGLQFLLTVAALIAYVRIWRHEDECNALAAAAAGHAADAEEFAKQCADKAPLARLQRLEGLVYSQRAPSEPRVAVEACENYLVAQKEGPGSAAALCVCDYCEEQRRIRRANKAAFGLRTPQEIANGKRTVTPGIASDGGGDDGRRSAPTRGRKKTTPQRPQTNGRAEDAPSSAQTGDGPQLPPQT